MVIRIKNEQNGRPSGSEQEYRNIRQILNGAQHVNAMLLVFFTIWCPSVLRGGPRTRTKLHGQTSDLVEIFLKPVENRIIKTLELAVIQYLICGTRQTVSKKVV